MGRAAEEAGDGRKEEGSFGVCVWGAGDGVCLGEGGWGTRLNFAV